MKKKTGLILSGVFLFSFVLAVGLVMADTSQATTATVTVNTFLSVTLSNTPITFTSMNPGETLSATVGTGFPLTATIGSESNVNANVKTKADSANFVEATNSSLTFLVSNMEWDFEDTFPGTGYAITDAIVCSSVTPGNACNIYHQLTIPSSQAAGTYSLGITVSAT